MKKLILISALLFIASNGWAQVSDDEIDNILVTAETDYFNLPFFNSDDNNGKPKKDPFETEEEYQLRLEKWVPKLPKNINFRLTKKISASEYNADNESWEHKIWDSESLGYFTRNIENSTYIGSNAFGAEREITKRRGDTGSFSLINIPKDIVISIPMERDLAREIYEDLEFIFVIEVNPDKFFFSYSRRRTYPEIDYTVDTDMTDYSIKAILKALVLRNKTTNEIVDYNDISKPYSTQAMSTICPSNQEIIPHTQPKTKKRRKTGGVMTGKVAKQLGAAQELIEEEKIPEGIKVLNEILSAKKLSDYEQAQVYYFLAYVEYLKEDYKTAITFCNKVLNLERVPEGLLSASRFTIAQLYFQLEDYQTAINKVDQMLMQDTEESSYINLYILKTSAAFQLKDYCTVSSIANYLLDSFDLGEQKEAVVKVKESSELYYKNSFSTF